MLRQAFEAVRSGFSPDRVVADPELNQQFLHECIRLGLSASPATLNRGLLNLRKRGELRNLHSLRTTFANEGEYRFAAEMAVRFLERRDGLSLDAIICDPDLATQFDQVAAAIAPGYSSLQYRWAALRIRKARRLQPEILAQIAPPTAISNWRVDELVLSAIPSEQGLYLFFTPSEPLYAGESHNLRSRLTKHIDHSDNKGLARWLWQFGTDQLHLQVQTLPDSTSTKVRRALEAELIRSRRPLFNIQAMGHSS